MLQDCECHGEVFVRKVAQGWFGCGNSARIGKRRGMEPELYMTLIKSGVQLWVTRAERLSRTDHDCDRDMGMIKTVLHTSHFLPAWQFSWLVARCQPLAETWGRIMSNQWDCAKHSYSTSEPSRNTWLCNKLFILYPIYVHGQADVRLPWNLGIDSTSTLTYLSNDTLRTASASSR